MSILLFLGGDIVRKHFLSFISSLCCLFLLLPSIVSAHPGRTDGNGGHTCRTNCEKWGLEYGEYHYHNGGGSSGSSSSGSTPTPSTPAPAPKPKIDEKQVQANQYYQEANSLYNSSDYRAAIDELEKIYELGKNDSKTDSLIQKSLSAIYGLATNAVQKEDYSTAKDHINYIKGNQRTSDQLTQQAETLLEQIEVNEKVKNLLSKATSLKAAKEYDEALGYIQEAKGLRDLPEITSAYDETIVALTKDAQVAYQEKQYKQALKFYKLLVKVAATPQLKAQFQATLQQIQDEQLLQEGFGIDKSDLDGKSLYTHLMEKENETPYNETIVDNLKSSLVESAKEAMHFIFNINIKELFKGGQKDAA
jgi:hypothetical protein